MWSLKMLKSFSCSNLDNKWRNTCPLWHDCYPLHTSPILRDLHTSAFHSCQDAPGKRWPNVFFSISGMPLFFWHPVCLLNLYVFFKFQFKGLLHCFIFSDYILRWTQVVPILCYDHTVSTGLFKYYIVLCFKSLSSTYYSDLGPTACQFSLPMFSIK